MNRTNWTKESKKFLRAYRDEDGDYFPEDLWGLEHTLAILLKEVAEAEYQRGLDEGRCKERFEVMNQRWMLADKLCEALGLDKNEKLEDGIVEKAIEKIEALRSLIK